MKFVTNVEQKWMRDDESTKGLLNLIEQLGDCSNKKMLEIGSFVGESTVLFASSFGQVIAVDPFLEGYDDMDPTSHSFDFKNVYETYLERTTPFKNIKTIKLTSNQAIDLLKDEQFDFIYLDGLHTYEGVRDDIKNYLPLVKPGGVIGGHDYTQNLEHLVGVYTAVNEAFGKPDRVYGDNSWIKYIK